ncbi:hypothetical protein K2X30_08565 [bacterium]|nr:hypothetical protein [bacterium]
MQSHPIQESRFSKAFEALWKEIFSSPVHLDSALSKQPKDLKPLLAQVIYPLLLRPISLAKLVDVPTSKGEPWSLSGPKLADWPRAREIAVRYFKKLRTGESLSDSEFCEQDFPPYLVEEWKKSWGAAKSKELMETLCTEPPLFLRVNRKFDRASVLQEFDGSPAQDVGVRETALSPLGIHFERYASVLKSASYEKGAFEIQDEGSQCMALFSLWPELFSKILSDSPSKSGAAFSVTLPKDPPAWNVVDACAGAGGKSLAIADALLGKGRVYAYDVAARKLEALRKRAKRSGLNNIQTVALEQGKEAETVRRFRRRAQVVLVDAPCTGWGVLRRNPDLKWRQDSDTLQRMPVLQKELLQVYSDLVAPGGRLVFGVCTFRKAETQDVAEEFTKANADFERGSGGYLGPGPTDGFYMQVWTRKA